MFENDYLKTVDVFGPHSVMGASLLTNQGSFTNNNKKPNTNLSQDKSKSNLGSLQTFSDTVNTTKPPSLLFSPSQSRNKDLTHLTEPHLKSSIVTSNEQSLGIFPIRSPKEPLIRTRNLNNCFSITKFDTETV